eukprot:scaffold2909_cov80-Skeletonema_menzelii.AAC.3
MTTTTPSAPMLDSSVTENDIMATSSFGRKGAPNPNHGALKDAIGRINNHNQAGNHVNNNVDNMNISINTLTNDVNTIARFLVVNEVDYELRFNAARSVLEVLMKALEENDKHL